MQGGQRTVSEAEEAHIQLALVALDALALHVYLALGGHDGLDIVGLGQGAHVHIIVYHQELVFQIRTAEPIALHLLDVGGIHAVTQQGAHDQSNAAFAFAAKLIALAEPGGHFFSEDTLTDQPERVIASEIVREKILRFTDKEIPHGVAVVTESMRDLGNLTEIDATIYCERATHKGIIIGKGGAMLKKIGSKAREDMERFFGCKINLRLWVKVKEDWRQRPQILTKLGFNEHDFDQYQ